MPHIIPISTAARSILPERADGDVFSTKRGTSLTNWDKAKRQLDRDSGVTGWVVHDIRRTVATGLQKLGVQLPVTGAILGHTSGSRAGIVGVYQRYDYAKEKRSALEAWGAHVVDLVEGNRRGGVVPLRRA